MKIAYVAVKGIPMSGGIEKYTEQMAQHLTARGHEVTVYTTRHYGNVTGKYKNFNIRTVCAFRNKYIEKISLVFFASVDQLRRNYDLVHYHALGPSIFAFTPKLQGKKVIIQSHGIEYQRARWGRFAGYVLKTLECLSYNMGDALTVVSKPLQRHFSDNYGKKTVFIPTAVEMPDLTSWDSDVLKEYGLEKNGYYLFLARLVEEKGAHYLIDAFKRLETERKLVIAGPIDSRNGYHQELLKRAESNNKILFIGEVSGKKKDMIFKGAYAFCLPSEIEGMSIALLEAMSYRKCCIVSDIEENMDIAKGHAIVFKNKDVDDLFRALNQMEYGDQKGLDGFCSDAYSYVAKNHSFEIIAGQMEQLYNDCER